MKLESEKLDGGVVELKLAGRMDVQGSQEIDLKFSAMTSADKGKFVVDISGVVFLASIGIRTLILSAKAVKARGGKMALLNPDANVSKVLEMASVDTVIPIFHDRNAAVAAVAA
jgi:anti-sigma B factor antagonist